MSENKNLKLKFKLKELEFEIEGNETTVKEEFWIFKSFLTNDVLPQINKIQYPTSTSEIIWEKKVIESKPITLEELDFPVMKQIIHSDLPKTEQEWILIYAFYASNYWEETFTRSNITDFYETSNRKTANRTGNISINLDKILNKGYIKFINDTEYLLKSEGIKYVQQILEGKSIAKSTISKAHKSKEKQTNTKKKSSSSQECKLDTNLNLRPKGKIGLKDYINQYKKPTSEEKILIFVYYLREELKEENISINQIFTCLKEIGDKIPAHLKQVIRNVKSSKGWINIDNWDDLNFTIQGMNHIEHDIESNK